MPVAVNCTGPFMPLAVVGLTVKDWMLRVVDDVPQERVMTAARRSSEKQIGRLRFRIVFLLRPFEISLFK
jgi:hypothetical protein